MKQFTGPDGQEDMPYVLTAGPVTTSRDVKFAMLADWDDRSLEFKGHIRNVLTSLKSFAEADSSTECVLIAGPPEGVVEAALGTFTPSKRKRTLIAANGPSAEHAIAIMQRIGRHHSVLKGHELQPLQPQAIAQALDDDRNISHVWVVQCELASGVINPIADIAAVVKSRDRVLMVDAVSSFGVLPVAMEANKIDVLVGCSGIGLEGPPGLCFALAKRDLLVAAKGECHSLTLDLFEQWQAFEMTGQFGSMPPTHAIAGLQQALRQLTVEGGVKGREERCMATAHSFNTRMRALGFSFLLSPHDTCPIIQTVLAPVDPRFNFTQFQNRLLARGFAIAPGLLPEHKSFRVGTIGQVDEKLMTSLVSAIEAVMHDMNVRSFAPHKDT